MFVLDSVINFECVCNQDEENENSTSVSRDRELSDTSLWLFGAGCALLAATIAIVSYLITVHYYLPLSLKGE